LAANAVGIKLSIKMREIKYIALYDLPNSKPERVYSLSATNKIDYICEALTKEGYQIHLISPSWITKPISKSKFVAKTTKKISACVNLTLGPSIGTSSRVGGYVKIVFSLLWLFGWLLRNVKRGEKIIVYHSPWLAPSILLAKKINKFKLLLEVEEIYADVSSLHPFFDKMEMAILRAADSFLFSTELLASKVSGNKDFVVIYGDYRVAESLSAPSDDGKVHLVYAGIIDLHKAGAFNAVESALYLDDKYVMHIIGFGEVEKLKGRIDEINKESSCCVLYDGTKNGADYVRFCQTCHIGLSTQKMGGKYLETSFPSKIISYLALGLFVVSCDVPCVAESRIGPFVNFYTKDTPRAIADAIKKVDVSKNSISRELINSLDTEFRADIVKLIRK
jgi:hypothetical protein